MARKWLSLFGRGHHTPGIQGECLDGTRRSKGGCFRKAPGALRALRAPGAAGGLPGRSRRLLWLGRRLGEGRGHSLGSSPESILLPSPRTLPAFALTPLCCFISCCHCHRLEDSDFHGGSHFCPRPATAYFWSLLKVPAHPETQGQRIKASVSGP